MSDPVRAEARALRHGRWQMALLIAALVVFLVRLVPEGDRALGEMSGDEYLDVLRPWTTIVVVAVDLWAAVLVVMLVRAWPTLPGSKAVRSAFLRASSVQMFWPILPGLLIWGWYGLPAGVMGLGCLIPVLAQSARVTAVRGASGRGRRGTARRG